MATLRAYLAAWVRAVVIALAAAGALGGAHAQLPLPNHDPNGAPHEQEGSYPAPGTIRLTEAERDWLVKHTTIWLGVDPYYPPFDFIGKDGSHQGIAADYINLITQKLDLRYDIVSARSGQELLDSFSKGRIDMIAAISKSPGRDSVMLFSEPYVSMPWAIITPLNAPYVHSLNDLRGKSIAVVGIRSVREKIERDYPQVKVKEALDVAAALDMVERGQVFAAITNLAVASELIEIRYEGQLKIASTVQGAMHELRFGVRKDWPELVSMLNKGLALISEEEHRAIRAKWLSGREEVGVNWRRALYVFGPIGTALLVVIGVVLVANRRLREQMAQRRQAELALKENEERLKEILRSAPEGVATIDQRGRITFWNPQAEQIFGYSAEEALGHDVHVLLAPARHLAIAGASMETFAVTGGGQMINQVVEIEGLHKDGREIPIDIARASYRQDNAWHAVAFFRDISARKEAEDAFRQANSMAQVSRARLLAMSDALPCATYQVMVEPDGKRKYTFVSKKVADILGVDLQTLREDSEARWRYLVPEDRERIRAMVDDAARNRAPLYCEYRVNLGGQIRWVRQEALPQQQPDGNWVWNGYWLDVTDVKKAEASLSDQLHFQRLLLDSLPNPVYFLAADGRYLGCNRAFEEAFGLEAEAIIGKTVLELEQFPRKARQAFYEDDLELIRQCGSRHLQAKVRFADGKHHEVLFWATGFRLSDGTPGGLIGIVVDISEQKRAEQLVKQTEAWYRSILEAAPDGMLVVDAEGRIKLANAQIEELFGYRHNELIGQPVEMLVPVRERGKHPVHRKHYVLSAETRAMGSGIELFARRKDGTEFPVEIGLSPLPRAEGQRPDVCTTVRDITERKRAADALRQAKEQAEQATRTKSMFLANMSHEIRTPMNAIIGMAHLALRTELTPKQRDYVSKIHGAGMSLLGIINDILDFSKIEAGKMGLESIEFGLDDVLGSLPPVAGHRAAEKGIEFLVHAAPEVPQNLVGDPLRLGQVLSNLVSNAVKFTERGEIEVSVQLQETRDQRVQLRFAVRDTGIGMESGPASRLFQPFTQADGSTTRKYGGTGLGLTICKRLVDLMGGRIWVESAPGQGSTFFFTAWFGLGKQVLLPVKVPESLQGLRLLVADDNAGVRDVLVETLQQFPFRVEAVAGAPAAIEAVKQADASDPIAVVLMDWQMPEMDGIEAVRRIKGDASLRRPPAIIMVTAFGHDEVRHEALQAGVDGFIAKPISQAMLLDAVLAAASPDAAQPPAAATELGPRDYGLQGARVLLTEDNDINRQIAAELLQNVGVEVVAANNGREALTKLADPAERRFDIVLMDLQMPEMDGFEATRLIRADERYKRLPIIAMTAHAMVEEVERCLSVGMNDHISKPIDPETLYLTLARWRPRGALDATPGRGGKRGEAAQTQIPLVQGIDTAGGLRRVAGNAKLYASLLQQFRASQADAPDRIRGGLMSGDRQLAERSAHTLKGVAANLGASEVRDAAAEVEQAIRQGYSLDEIDEPLGRLEGLLDGLVARLAEVWPGRPPSPVEAATPARPDASGLNALVKALAGYLEDNDGEAVDFLEANRARLRGAFLGADFARFEKAVKSFDFDAALEQLKDAVHAAEIAI